MKENADKIEFSIKKVKRNDIGWKVTGECDNFPDYEIQYFSSKKELNDYINEWTDITIGKEDPYQPDTKWWFFNVEKECIVPVVIKEIRTKVDTGIKFFYSSLVFESGEEFNTRNYSSNTKKEVLEELSKILKKDYMEFIYRPHQQSTKIL